MKRLSVTVILPTYNEAENIIPLIRAIRSHTPSGTNILVVDDNSPDDTASRVKISAHVKLLVRYANRGLTNSLIDGIQSTKSDVVVWMDCDFSHPPNIIPHLLHSIDEGFDVALAARIRKDGLSLLLNTFIMLLFGSGISDYTTGFLAVRRSVLDRIPLQGDYGEYCIDLLVRAKRAGFKVEEIPYHSPPRLHGQSKTSLRHGFGYIITILRLLWTSGK